MRRQPVTSWGATACTFLLLCSGFQAQPLSSSKHPLYVNRAYEYQVSLPRGVTYERSQPPNPDHESE